MSIPEAFGSPGTPADRRHRARVHGRLLIRGGTRFHQEAGQPEPLDEILGGPI